MSVPTQTASEWAWIVPALGVTVQVIEKDFWVCWVLRHLFTIDTLGAGLCFKGGTSLSKVFGIIERMSEDIDLVIDREALGFTGDRDPSREDLSGKARKRLIEELKAEAASLVGGPLSTALEERFVQQLGQRDPKIWSLRADVSNPDNTFINFHYPNLEEPSAFLRPMVMLELGARGDTWPKVDGTVTPYAAGIMPGQFISPTASVPTITAERTFWEKATLLHTVAFRDLSKPIGNAVARHYYDVHKLIRHETGKNALRDHELLAQVVRHKSTFYPGNAYRYDLAVPRTLRLVPQRETIEALRPQYAETAEIMVFGEAPGFDTVLGSLAQAESQLRRS